MLSASKAEEFESRVISVVFLFTLNVTFTHQNMLKFSCNKVAHGSIREILHEGNRLLAKLGGTEASKNMNFNRRLEFK